MAENQQGQRQWTTVDKSDWGDGPWMTEPDKVQWIDEATGLDCLIVRGPMTNLCGYVGLPPGHPYHGAHHDATGDLDDLDVHGGLTFSDKCMENVPEGEGVCHIPAPGRPDDVWWLGFDCGHAFDVMPGRDAQFRAMGIPPLNLPEMPWGPDQYRDIDYVRSEVTRLAAQLAQAK